MKIPRVLIVLAGTALALTSNAFAVDLEIRGTATERTVDSLDAAWQDSAKQPETHWVGWTVESIAGSVNHGDCQVSLGDERHRWRTGDASADEAYETTVLLELKGRRIHDVEIADSGCEVDARGVELEIWNGISTEESYRFLDELLLGHSDTELRADGVSAIAKHRLDVVDQRLERVALEDGSEDVRHAAIFWLGAARGLEGYRSLRNLEGRLSASDVEEAVVFGYYVSEIEEATDRLFQLARGHENAEVRGQALFWIAQEAGDAATSELERAVEDDPDTEVQEQAVFGLSQLPPDRGIPALVKVARNHRNPEVRESAFFWLGQSKDPRAMELFAEVLGVN